MGCFERNHSQLKFNLGQFIHHLYHRYMATLQHSAELPSFSIKSSFIAQPED
jgi:hypothetical protein